MKSLTQHIQQKAVTGTQLIGDVGGEALLAFTLVHQMWLFIFFFPGTNTCYLQHAS